MTVCALHSFAASNVCLYCERERLETEVENLKFRLSMAESNNPDSVLSKHNALMMVCARRDELKTELDTLKRQLTEEVETRGKLEAELEHAQLRLGKEIEQHDAALADAERYREALQKAESERDTARAELAKVEARERELQHDLQKVSMDAGARESRLQAKVARAVAELTSSTRELGEDNGAFMARRISRTLEALR